MPAPTKNIRIRKGVTEQVEIGRRLYKMKARTYDGLVEVTITEVAKKFPRPVLIPFVAVPTITIGNGKVKR